MTIDEPPQSTAATVLSFSTSATSTVMLSGAPAGTDTSMLPVTAKFWSTTVSKTSIVQVQPTGLPFCVSENIIWFLRPKS